MKNLYWKLPETGRLVLDEEELRDLQPGEVLVRMEYCGICGSDMHFFTNGCIGTRKAPPDFILGHEVSGTVVQTGGAVETLACGDRVALEPGIPCGKCEFCRKGLYNLCPSIRFLASAAPPTHGALRKYMIYPAEWCYKLPQSISTLEGCMIEPLSVGMHAAYRGEVGLGKTVFIIGVGTIGYMTMLACKAMSASRVIVSDALENRLALAKQAGADAAINVKTEDALQRVMELTDGCGADVVFDAAGSPFTLASTWKYVKRGGVVVNVGNAGGEVPFLFDEMARKEADIRQVWRYRHIYPVAIDALESGKIDLSGVNPRIFPFAEAEQAFHFAFEHRNEVLKTVIDIQDDQRENV